MLILLDYKQYDNQAVKIEVKWLSKFPGNNQVLRLIFKNVIQNLTNLPKHLLPAGIAVG